MNHQLHQTEQLMLNFGEMPRYQPANVIDSHQVSQHLDALFNKLYNTCAALGFNVVSHASLSYHTSQRPITPVTVLAQLTALQFELFRLTHHLGFGRYSAAAFTEFYNSRLTYLYPDGKIHWDSNNRPIPPDTFIHPDYSAVLALHNPRPLFADHVNPPVITDDNTQAFTD